MQVNLDKTNKSIQYSQFVHSKLLGRGMGLIEKSVKPIPVY